jgi:hypothetical protein
MGTTFPFRKRTDGTIRRVCVDLLHCLRSDAPCIRKRKRARFFGRRDAGGEQIQSSILPEVAPTALGFNIAFRYEPMTSVAGDFCDFMPLLPSGLGIIAADVAGHGVPAALVASMLKVAISSGDHSLDHPGRSDSRVELDALWPNERPVRDSGVRVS